ncbi:MAG: hypothetical protein Q9173_003108 [Seirophora scorigena]
MLSESSLELLYRILAITNSKKDRFNHWAYLGILLSVLTQKLYIITAPEDVAAAFKTTTSLNFDGHLNELLINFGFEGEALRLAWYEARPGDPRYLPESLVTPRQKSLNRLTEEVYKQQLLPGEKMDVMCRVFVKSLSNTLQWERLGFCTVTTCQDTRHVSLRALCRHTMVDAATRWMFGSHLHAIEPDIVNHMLGFNDFAWMVFFQYPDYFGSPVSAPRKRITEALKVFISLPEEQRSEQAWSIKTVLTAQDIVGIDLKSKASVLLMIYWAANSNEYNISFWVLAHLLFNETLLEIVRSEVEAAWSNGSLDIKYLCANSPSLDAIFLEALRLNGGAMMGRKVLAATEIGGKILEPGNSTIIPSHQLHTNRDVWGDDVGNFDAFRFAKKKSLARHSSYRPFGGGVTYCPGRVLAKEEVFGFVAILLRRFTIKLASSDGSSGHRQVFPKLDDSSPALGITGPVKGMDVLDSIALPQLIIATSSLAAYLLQGYAHSAASQKSVDPGLIWCGVAVSFLCLVLRLYARWRSFKRFWFDDLFVVIAWLLALLTAIDWQIVAGYGNPD